MIKILLKSVAFTVQKLCKQLLVHLFCNRFCSMCLRGKEDGHLIRDFAKFATQIRREHGIEEKTVEFSSINRSNAVSLISFGLRLIKCISWFRFISQIIQHLMVLDFLLRILGFIKINKLIMKLLLMKTLITMNIYQSC